MSDSVLKSQGWHLPTRHRVGLEVTVQLIEQIFRLAAVIGA